MQDLIIWDERDYHPCNKICIIRRRKLGLEVPGTEADIEKLECEDEPCFLNCPIYG